MNTSLQHKMCAARLEQTYNALAELLEMERFLIKDNPGIIILAQNLFQLLHDEALIVADDCLKKTIDEIYPESR